MSKFTYTEHKTENQFTHVPVHVKLHVIISTLVEQYAKFQILALSFS